MNKPNGMEGVHGYADALSLKIDAQGEGSIIYSDPTKPGDLRVSIRFEIDGKSTNPNDPYPGQELNTIKGPFKELWDFPTDAPWHKTSAGIVVVSRALDGYWFIPKSLYEPQFEKLRNQIK